SSPIRSGTSGSASARCSASSVRAVTRPSTNSRRRFALPNVAARSRSAGGRPSVRGGSEAGREARRKAMSGGRIIGAKIAPCRPVAFASGGVAQAPVAADGDEHAGRLRLPHHAADVVGDAAAEGARRGPLEHAGVDVLREDVRLVAAVHEAVQESERGEIALDGGAVGVGEVEGGDDEVAHEPEALVGDAPGYGVGVTASRRTASAQKSGAAGPGPPPRSEDDRRLRVPNKTYLGCHYEERSDEAISLGLLESGDCRASAGRSQ